MHSSFISISLSLIAQSLSLKPWTLRVCSRNEFKRMKGLVLLQIFTTVIGAYCLGVSMPPSTHRDKGFGAASRNWVLKFEAAYNLPFDVLLLPFLLTIRMGKQIHFFIILCLITKMTPTEAELINITKLESAVASGAVCLDGSPPAYYYAMGSEDGYDRDKWLVNLEGGGWCTSNISCKIYIQGGRGSSKPKNDSILFDGIFSGNKTTNPDFYNWNRVYVVYCDGSSYLGNVEEVDRYENFNFTRRGARVFDAIMNDLLDKGMKNASMAILSGVSAGGLGALLRCDGFRTLVPTAVSVKCISDAGFFLHGKNLFGADFRERIFFGGIVDYHGLNKSLPPSCISKFKPELCLFPENFIKDIKTPLFLLQSAFDSFQLQKLFFANGTTWQACTTNLACTNEDFRKIQGFGKMFLEELEKIRNCSSLGIFVNSCYLHNQLEIGPKGWDASPMLENYTIAKAIGDWYFDRHFVQVIDNQTIPHLCC